ncbi:hypothetical protein BG006_006348 [Podila minutissima]|uniref:Uncharacterized protein n=1 Tax=Podila minutissima TaxID=64525 RepID=A0A9P5SJG2_9FUNG|nr:hypothetical protein BG006_006348 [Podila minutissima]
MTITTTANNDTAAGQRLPNECLLGVFAWLNRDFNTLRSLLTVNKFFFHASAPALFVSGINSKNIDNEKLLVLILSSIVHYPKEDELLASGEDISLASTSDLFKPFELQLVEPVTFPSLLPSGPKPIVDYAKFVHNLPSSFYSQVKLYPIIRIADHAYMALRKRKMAIPPTIVDQLMSHYKLSLFERINFLLLHHSPENVKNITLHVKDSAQYLPLATEMCALERVYLQRDETIPKPILDNLLSFIKLHRTSFPYKTQFGIDHTNNGSSIGHRSNRDPVVKHRRLVEYHESTVAILEAIGRPSFLDVTYFPGFYAACAHVDMAGLQRFIDKSKRQPSEVSAQQELIKNATGMHSLVIHVTDARLFDWCLGQSPQGPWLPKLRILGLVGDKGEELLPAMENAIHGFRESPLDEVFVQLKCVSRSLKYTHVFSGWNLPWIRRIRIRVDGLGTLPYLGAFDCPQLEYLHICGMECSVFFDSLGSSNNNDDNVENNNSNRMFDLETGDWPMAPVWHLPRLKGLTLINNMAMMFDYDSLAFMPALENLSLSSRGEQKYVKNVPPLMTHVTRQPSISSEKDETFDRSTSGTEKHQQPPRPKWPGPWHLPKLKNLTMTGSPALVFSFDWLRGCPRLELIELNFSENSGQRLPLSWESPTALVPLSDLDASGASQSTQQDSAMEPMYRTSVLRRFVLRGNWQMSEQDLTAVLTDYMPNLTALELRQLRVGVNTSNMMVFNVFEEVDRIHVERGRCSRLMDVKLSFVPDEAAKTRLRLVRVPAGKTGSRNQDWRRERRGSKTVGYRIYDFDRQSLTTKEPTIELYDTDRE